MVFVPLMIAVVAVYLALSLPIRIAQQHRQAEMIAEFLSAAPYLQPGATLITLRVRAEKRRDALFPRADMILQAQSHLAARLPMIGLKNIQINSGITPVHYRPGLNPYRHLADDVAISRTVPRVDLARYYKNTGRHVDFVILWGREKFFRPGAKAHTLKTSLEQDYEMIFHAKGSRLLRLYKRKTK